MNAHPEFRMAMKDGELVIWIVFTLVTPFSMSKLETFSSLWSEYHDDFRQFLHIYSQDVVCYGENLAYFLKGLLRICFVSANPWVSFTSFDLNVANMDNFFAPVFTMGKYYTQGDKGADAAGDSGSSCRFVMASMSAECLMNYSNLR